MEAKTKSKQGCSYWMTFTDDYSRYGMLAFLKNKDDALDAFKKFLASAELETGERMRILRSDGGGEYCSREFEAFLAEKGIKHEKTNAYTPQENGVAKRRNLTLANQTRALLDENKLPTYLWQTAANHAQRITNILPSRSIPLDTTPHELWHKQKPNLTHLQVFGSKAWAHIPAKHRVKFDDRAIECVYVGYVANKRSYLLFQRSTGKLIESRDVKFDKGTGEPQRIVVEISDGEGDEDESGKSSVKEASEGDEGDKSEEHVPSNENPTSTPADDDDVNTKPDPDPDAIPQPPPLRRSTQKTRAPDPNDHPKFDVSSRKKQVALSVGDEQAFVASYDPDYFRKMASPEAPLWREAMNTEMEVQKKMETY
jgi:hypothetical protein